jgi:hypothetical protein
MRDITMDDLKPGTQLCYQSDVDDEHDPCVVITRRSGSANATSSPIEQPGWILYELSNQPEGWEWSWDTEESLFGGSYHIHE